jgi:hypothetical protein
MTADMVDKAAADAAQDDLGAFARMVGRPLEPWQLAALKLETWQTILVAPRQCGKSYSLAVLAAWWACMKPRQEILVISSVEESALELLENVRELAGHPLLAGAVFEELKFRVVLKNKSRIRSVTSSQRAVRGKSIDLLIMDEAAFIEDDVLGAAALPTTAARPAARVVVASTPWGSEGTFYNWAMAGLDPENPITRTFAWQLSDAPWIQPHVIEAARQTLPRQQFEAEYLGRWVSAGSFFDRDDLMACVADFEMTRNGAGTPAVIGLDWGRQRDRHAIAVAGLMNDFGVNARSVIVVAWVETSRRGYDEQLAEVAEVAGMWSVTALRSEVNGPGQPVTDQLRKKVRVPVTAVFTGQREKAAAYARLSMLFEQRAIVLANDPETLKQFLGVTAKPLPGGGLKIEARLESIHDDIPDAVAMAVAGLLEPLAEVPDSEPPDGTEWLQTPGGVLVPVPLLTMRSDQAYAINGEVIQCKCGGFYRAVLPRCRHCQADNPRYDPSQHKPGAAPAKAAALLVAAEDGPSANWWDPHLRQCARDENHKYDGRSYDKCPHCDPGAGGSRMPRGGPMPGIGGIPAGLATRLGGILGPRF